MAVIITGNNTPTAGGVVYGDGSTYATTTAGTSGRPIVSGGAGAPTFRPYTLPAADGSANQLLQTDGAGALSFATVSAGFTLATPVNVSGTSVSFTGIPSGAKQIVLMFKSVRSNAAVNKFIQRGDSGGFITTGYVAQEAYITGSEAVDSFTDAWRVRGDAASYTTISGAMTFTRYDGSAFTYVGAGTFSYPEINKATTITSGFVTLNSVLTQIRVTVTGTTYDTGSINIAYI